MFLAEVIFLTRFLGLVAGEQPVRLKVDSDVRQVQIRRDGQTIATLHGPRWGAKIDFGNELTPHGSPRSASTQKEKRSGATRRS